MSEIAGELTRVNDAFSQPTLTLLHQRQAPVVITIFRAAFGRNNRPIPTARLHVQVDEHLAEFRHAGETDLPAGPGARSANAGCAASGWCGPWTSSATRSTP